MIHYPKSSLRLRTAATCAVACLLLASANGFSLVRNSASRPSSTPSIATSPSAAATSSPFPLSATSAATLSDEKPQRRKFLRSVRRTVMGVVTASSIRQQLSERRRSRANRIADAKVEPIATNGNIVELQVGNVGGAGPRAQSGTIKIQLYPEWAPVGAKRFEELVSQAFYNEARIFRVVPNVLVQFGIHGDPEISALWRSASISDDPVRAKNSRGTLFFCKTASGPINTGRTTQIAINTSDNAFLDGNNFAPFGRVIEGMDLVDRFYAGYSSNEPNPGMIQAKGDTYLRTNFPKLSYISKATVVVKQQETNKTELV